MAVNGKWNLVIKTPMGDQQAVLSLSQEGDALNGEMSGAMGSVPIQNGRVEGESLKWSAAVTSPMPITLEFDGKLDGGNIAGNVKLGAFGSSTFSGTPA
ncbi:hypothetical protein [Amphiplicatus metriothermophilus]|uniref:Uncharacterized protein n=1 Tax=Amphiplicatus metriothermophilus TaxID=1519374 RepID=A0A239PY20_9PROT|nr:hypothetical protein [Amphiplicatus metriothermophilus]MBB5519951.1 hypothetical protein [Amphiplicatus metriothermophilus]SNT74852.1 hypothetical protein SAMN06297382_2442 [Amphiplicatus metriothermophilus]